MLSISLPRMNLYLMSPPGLSRALSGRSNFRSLAAASVDPARARFEWITLADQITLRGGGVLCLLPPRETALTGLPYAAECGLLVANGETGRPRFLLPTLLPVHRRGERELWAEVAESLGLETISVRGTWEAAGDVAAFAGHTLLFYGGRTTEEGARHAASFLGQSLERIVFVEIREPAFHGNMAVLPLPAADRMLFCPEVISEASRARLVGTFGDDRLVPVTVDEIRGYATNGLPIGNDVLAPHLTPLRIRALFEAFGLHVVLLPMHELCEKGGGAARCLVSHVELPDGALTVPARYDYPLLRPDLVSSLPSSFQSALVALSP